MKTMISQISPNIGDLKGNLNIMKQEVLFAQQHHVDVVVFPELVTTGYPPRDLLYDQKIWDSHDNLVREFTAFINSLKRHITVIFGGLHQVAKTHGRFARYNAAFIIDPTYGVRVVHKKLLPCYDVFDENIYFMPGDEPSIPLPIDFFDENGIRETHYCDVIICEDMWNFRNRGTVRWMSPGSYLRDPVSELTGDGAVFIINASPFWYGKVHRTLGIVEDICKHLKRPVVWANQIGGYDDLVFGGYSMVVAPTDYPYPKLLKHVCGAFCEDRVITRLYGVKSEILQPKPDDSSAEKESIIAAALATDEGRAALAHPIFPNNGFRGLRMPLYGSKHVDLADFEDWCVLAALKLALLDYCKRTGFKRVVFGSSGGIDSALVGAIAAEALGGENVTAITMPSKYSSTGSWKDSEELARNCKMQLIHWDIKRIHEEVRAVALSGGKTKFNHNVTDENIMPRIRATLLMSYSNDEKALLVSTGNKSESAVGYCTLYGDTCGGFALLIDVYKTLVYRLARLINKYNGVVIPEGVIVKAPSAELAEGQKDTDSLPPYDVLDPMLGDMIENNLPLERVKLNTSMPEQVSRVARMIEMAEHKRSQAPIGPKVTERAFGSGRDIPIAKKVTYI